MTSAIRLHVLAAVASTGLSLSAPAQAQQATMSFFVTSVGKGNGGFTAPQLPDSCNICLG